MKAVPYPDYKDSGQPFLGRVPSHWSVFRNGRLFLQRVETGYGDLPILEVSLKTGVRVRDMDDLKRKQMMSDRDHYKRAVQGDIAYNMMRMWQGAVGVVPVSGLVSPAYVVARPFSEANSRYYAYLFRTPAYMGAVDTYSRGIVKDRNRLYWQDFKRMPSPVPPVEEQDQIVRFLDANGSKVQRFIRNKRRLIGLLKEQKQNIINQAVTRGLDPNAKLKPSGVEWIGDIPAHWEVRRLKTIANVVLGKMLKTTPSDGDELKPYLRSTNIQWFRPNISDVASMWFSPREMAQYRVTKGDILVSEGGEVGRACIWQDEFEECYIQNSVHKVTVSEAILPHFLLYQFSSFSATGVFRAIVNRVSIAHLTSDKLGAVTFCLPPLHEQQEVISHIKDKFSEIDAAITRAEREIELIREYRARLISDAVTGQVDVRGIEVPEVTEEELQALDDAPGEAEELVDDEAAAKVAQ